MHSPTLQDEIINSQNFPLSESGNHIETQINDSVSATESTKAASNDTSQALETTIKHTVNHALENNSVYIPENNINAEIEDSYDNGDDFMWPPGRKYGPRFPEQTPQQILDQQASNYHFQKNYQQSYAWDNPVQVPEENPVQSEAESVVMQPVYWKHNGRLHKNFRPKKLKESCSLHTNPKKPHKNATESTSAPTNVVAAAKSSGKQKLKLNASAKPFMPNVRRKEAANQNPNNDQSPKSTISTTETQCSCNLIPQSGSKKIADEVFKPKDSTPTSCTNKLADPVEESTNNTVAGVENTQYVVTPKSYAEITATAKIPHYATKQKIGNMFASAVDQEADKSSACQKIITLPVLKSESSLATDNSTSEERNSQDLEAKLLPSSNKKHNIRAYADVAMALSKDKPNRPTVTNCNTKESSISAALGRLAVGDESHEKCRNTDTVM